MAKGKQTPKKKKSRKAATPALIRGLPEFKLDLAHDPEKYQVYQKKGARLHYTMFLMMLTIFNFLTFLALVPLMMLIRSAFLVLILGGLGLVFGMVYLYLVRDVEHLKPKHHMFAALYIPFIAIINIIALFLIGKILHNRGGYESLFIFYASAVYVVMFLLPYAITSLFERLWPRKRKTI